MGRHGGIGPRMDYGRHVYPYPYPSGGTGGNVTLHGRHVRRRRQRLNGRNRGGKPRKQGPARATS